ncbi:MAG: type II toxin-antitoxin system VapC family toxin [Candidatus Bathyarchaeia archaeon]
MKFVDTTFIIALLRGDKTTVEKASELNEEGGAATTVINVYEASYGVYRSMTDPPRRLMELERLLQNLDIFSLDYRAALMAAKISGELERKGIGIDPFDSLVAAIALVNGADSLITRNVSHFNRIDDLKTETH